MGFEHFRKKTRAKFFWYFKEYWILSVLYTCFYKFIFILGQCAWKIPSQMVRVKDPLVLEVVTPDLLKDTLNLFYLHRDVAATLNSSLTHSLGIESLNTEHLLLIGKSLSLQWAAIDGRDKGGDKTDLVYNIYCCMTCKLLYQQNLKREYFFCIRSKGVDSTLIKYWWHFLYSWRILCHWNNLLLISINVFNNLYIWRWEVKLCLSLEILDILYHSNNSLVCVCFHQTDSDILMTAKWLACVYRSLNEFTDNQPVYDKLKALKIIPLASYQRQSTADSTIFFPLSENTELSYNGKFLP